MDKDLYRKAEKLAWKIRSLKNTMDRKESIFKVPSCEVMMLSIDFPKESGRGCMKVTVPGFLINEITDILFDAAEAHIEEYQNEFLNL